MPEDLSNPATIYGVYGLLVLALTALLTGRYVITRKHHEDVVAQLGETIKQLQVLVGKVEQDRDEYRAMLIKVIETNDRSLTVTQQLIKKRPPAGGGGV